MLVTVVLDDEALSAETKARSSSFAEAVENESVLTVVLGDAASLETVASMAIAARTGGAQKLMIKLRRATQITRRMPFMVVLCVRHHFLHFGPHPRRQTKRIPTLVPAKAVP